jgi:DNA-3-methyladenine glycosylase I
MPKTKDWSMHHHPKMPKPKNADGYFENLVRVTFTVGLNWKVIMNKWPNFKKAFASFSVKKVAKFDQRHIDRLMKDPGIVRNYLKIEGTIENARQMLALEKEFGSFKKYLENLRKQGGEQLLAKELSKRFAFLGKGTAVMFLLSVGEPMPKAIADWKRQHRLGHG